MLPSISEVTITEGKDCTICLDAGGAALSPLNALI